MSVQLAFHSYVYKVYKVKVKSLNLKELIFRQIKNIRRVSDKHHVIRILDLASPVAEGRHGGEDPEAGATDNHRELVSGPPGDCLRVGYGEDHEREAGQEVADVEEEKATEY